MKNLSQKPIPKPKPPHLRAFVLMELVLVVMLFSVFLFIASKLFITTLNAQTAATKQDSLIHQTDSALSLLRKDVWASNHITFDEGQLKLLGPNDGPVQWDLRSPHHLSRTTPHSSTTFPDLPNPTVQLQGPLVKLTFNNSPHPPESLTLLSQILLNNGDQ